ncbi:hypothetical protein AFLA_000350 [Aspergillus flavus NRRL3357]|nr:hypothetical protein AFLA_000350 [Aspergillus flavus NRRL3357]
MPSSSLEGGLGSARGELRYNRPPPTRAVAPALGRLDVNIVTILATIGNVVGRRSSIFKMTGGEELIRSRSYEVRGQDKSPLFRRKIARHDPSFPTNNERTITTREDENGEV